jgi:hypothetical protein
LVNLRPHLYCHTPQNRQLSAQVRGRTQRFTCSLRCSVGPYGTRRAARCRQHRVALTRRSPNPTRGRHRACGLSEEVHDALSEHFGAVLGVITEVTFLPRHWPRDEEAKVSGPELTSRVPGRIKRQPLVETISAQAEGVAVFVVAACSSVSTGSAPATPQVRVFPQCVFNLLRRHPPSLLAFRW